MLLKPGILLRVEGAVLFAVSLFLYHLVGANWWVFLLLCIWPDLSMLGYLVGVRLGAGLYNLVHTDAFPVALVGVALGWHRAALLPFALIWLAHIGLDRTLGYGLKYPTFFKDTHLQRVGSSRIA